jgi:hypothetical protein
VVERGHCAPQCSEAQCGDAAQHNGAQCGEAKCSGPPYNDQTRDVFEPSDFLFAWDLKDGYWHIDLHPEFWTYMAFGWPQAI